MFKMRLKLSKLVTLPSSSLSILILLLTLHNEIDHSFAAVVPHIRIYELNGGNLTMLDEPPNTDVVLRTNRDNPERYLILQCRAPYAVQWIYSGDGVPEFITNTTVSWETEPKQFVASAGLFRLFEHHTGTYTCRSIQSPHLSSYYHMFFTGEHLLAPTVGDTISFSRHDPTVRIPCSVSDPSAHVTLQKLVEGYINCPVNDTISFNKKTGFTLKVTKDYQPFGEYICIAHNKEKWSVLEYKVIMEEHLTTKKEIPPTAPTELMPSLKPVRPTLSTSEASSTNSANFIGLRPANPSPRPSNTQFSPTSSTSGGNGRTKCSAYSCGRNAQCQLNALELPVCKCEAHFKGDPYIRCYPECIVDTDCPSNRICFDNACENPCPTACGVPPTQLLSCLATNHTAICTYRHCNPSPCGPYSECRHLSRGALCSCLPGYSGSPPNCAGKGGFGQPLFTTTTLRVTENGNYSDTAVTSPSFITTLKPVKRPSHPESPGPIRTNHDNFNDSPQSDPALEIPLPGIAGIGPTAVDIDDIFDLDAEMEIKQDRNPDKCWFNRHCNKTDQCIDSRCKNPCQPNPCGRSTICAVKNHEPVCTCQPGFIRVNQYCLITNCKSKRDCPGNKTCVRNKCINPCAGYCGKMADCKVEDHSPRCTCPPGFSGDPYKDCSKYEATRAAEDGEEFQFQESDESEVFELPVKVSTQRPTMFPFPTPGIISPFKYCGQVLKCGTNAHCVFNTSNAASHCKCEDGFSGDPYRICYLEIVKLDDFVQTVSDTPEVEFIHVASIFKNKKPEPNKTESALYSDTSKNSKNNTNAEVVTESTKLKIKVADDFCVRDTDCPRDKSCIGDSCMNPCSFESICGENQVCKVRDHKATCKCKEGFPLKIYNNCYPEETRNSQNQSVVLCEPSPCGPNSDCTVTKVSPYVSCKCKPNMGGRPPNCRSTCVVDYECPEKLACINATCQDPCEGLCGYLARCRVYQHQAKCFCPQGFKVVREKGVVQCQPPLYPDTNGRVNIDSDSDTDPDSDVLAYAYGTGSTFYSDEGIATSTDPARSVEATTVFDVQLQSDEDLDLDSDLNDKNMYFEVPLKMKLIPEASIINQEAGVVTNLKENLDKIGNQNPDKNNEFNAKLGLAADGSHEHYFSRKGAVDKNVFDNPIFPMPSIPKKVKPSKAELNAKVNEKLATSTHSNTGNLREKFQEEDFDDSIEFVSK